MAIPAKVRGACNSSLASNNYKNAFRITFSRTVSAPPSYEAYDGNWTGVGLALVGTGTTTTNSLFDNGVKPWLCLADTFDWVPGVGVSSWAPATKTTGGASANRMYGGPATTGGSWVVAGNAPRAGECITFNMAQEIPPTATPASTTAFELQIRYTYTGAPPDLSWAFCEAGTDNAPQFTDFTPGTNGFRFATNGSPGTYVAPIPSSTATFATECWVV